MTKDSVRIEVRGKSSASLSQMLYSAATHIENSWVVEDMVIETDSGDLPFGVEMTIDVTNAAFGSKENDPEWWETDCVMQIAYVLRKAGKKAAEGAIEQKLIDANGNPVGRITVIGGDRVI